MYITFDPAILYPGFYPPVSRQKHACLRGREHPSGQSTQDTWAGLCHAAVEGEEASLLTRAEVFQF